MPWNYKGFTIEARSPDELGSSATLASLQQLAATGANTVIFTLTWYVDSIKSTTVHQTYITGTDASLNTAIGEAKALGLKVVIKPHVDSADAQWRAKINPCASSASDSSPCPAGDSQVAAWFASYDAMIVHYADIAQQQGADALCIGAELIDMSTNPNNVGQWRSLISTVRGHFSGKLTYSGNWGSGSFATEFNRIPFWDALDYIGLSAYWPLSTSYSPTVSEMVAQWTNTVQPQIAAVQKRAGKPVIFAEDGYRSVDGAATSPSTYSGLGNYNGQVQADCYEATFEAWANVPWFAGGWFWEWGTSPGVGGAGDQTYFVQNKPAQAVITRAFGGSGTVTPGSGSPTATRVSAPTGTATSLPAPTSTPTGAPTSTPSATSVPTVVASATASATPSPTTTTAPTATATYPAPPTSGQASATALASVPASAATATQQAAQTPGAVSTTATATAPTPTAGSSSTAVVQPTAEAATATTAAVETATTVAVATDIATVSRPRATATPTRAAARSGARSKVQPALVHPVTLSAARIAPHKALLVRTVIGNSSSLPLHLRNVVYFLRSPAVHGHGRHRVPARVLVLGASGPLTLAAHRSYAFGRAYRFSIHDVSGVYTVYVSWKLADGTWHDQRPQPVVRLVGAAR